MAHDCFSCGGECYCNGDIDDCNISLTPSNCNGCGCADEDEYFSGEEDEDHDHPWLCSCGHYEESGLHCSVCGNEPPWGCPCSGCSESYCEDPEEWEYPDY